MDQAPLSGSIPMQLSGLSTLNFLWASSCPDWCSWECAAVICSKFRGFQELFQVSYRWDICASAPVTLRCGKPGRHVGSFQIRFKFLAHCLTLVGASDICKLWFFFLRVSIHFAVAVLFTHVGYQEPSLICWTKLDFWYCNQRSTSHHGHGFADYNTMLVADLDSRIPSQERFLPQLLCP